MYDQRIMPLEACREKRKTRKYDSHQDTIYYLHAAVKWGAALQLFWFACLFVPILELSHCLCSLHFSVGERLILRPGRGSSGTLTVSPPLPAVFIRRNERFIWQQQFTMSATFTALREEDRPSAHWHKTRLQQHHGHNYWTLTDIQVNMTKKDNNAQSPPLTIRTARRPFTCFFSLFLFFLFAKQEVLSGVKSPAP